MAEQEKSKGELLAEKILYQRKNAAEENSQFDAADVFAIGYKKFLDEAKTEREAVDYTLEYAIQKGYKPFEDGKQYKAGDKIFYNNRGKAIIFATIGTEGVKNGVKILASHIDSPRLDLKPNPLYEDSKIALFKTHYYGGIKKYQWSALPLALHGIVAKKDGTTVKIKIGDDEKDPQFCVTDLLPHLADDQQKRMVKDALKGEELNVLLGSLSYPDDKVKDRVKLNIMNLLHEKYDIVEDDFISAELVAVPAHKARDIGLDRSMIGSYGHDDRVCAYTSFMAEMENVNPKYTSVTILTDKEEIGSDGNTGLNSSYFRYFIEKLADVFGENSNDVLSKSKCLSADVNAAFDPTFPEVHERNNACYLNGGVVITKYTGSGGKYGTSDASAEFMAYIRRILDDKNIYWQTGELGKVDQGGGGTVAKYLAALNIDVVDVGVPVLSMHSPFEVVSKLDTFMTYRAFSEFLSANE